MTDQNLAATNAVVLFHQEYLTAMEMRQVVDVPPATRAMMIGPHPDDIVLGCGGTAIKYEQLGVPVHFLCLTDGRACVSDPQEREHMVAIRAEEERRAGEICGATSVELLAFREDEFTEPSRLDEYANQLAAVIDEIGGDAIFVPYFFELHPWHRYTDALLAKTLETSAFRGTIYAYAVLSLVPPTHVVDTSAVIDKKESAVRAYASQMALRDYVKDMMMMGAVHAPLVGHDARTAETFQSFDRQEFIERVSHWSLADPRSLSCGAQPVKPEEPV